MPWWCARTRAFRNISPSNQIGSLRRRAVVRGARAHTCADPRVVRQSGLGEGRKWNDQRKCECMHRAVMREVIPRLGAEKFDQASRTSSGFSPIRLCRAESSVTTVESEPPRARSRPRGQGSSHRVHRAGTSGAFPLRGALESSCRIRRRRRSRRAALPASGAASAAGSRRSPRTRALDCPISARSGVRPAVLIMPWASIPGSSSLAEDRERRRIERRSRAGRCG